MLSKAMQLVQSLALARCGAMRAVPQTAIPRQLNFPFEAFDELQAVKRRHGLRKNADAVAYGLFVATAVDQSALLPSLATVPAEVTRG